LGGSSLSRAACRTDILVNHSRIAGLAALHPRPGKRARPCLPWFVDVITTNVALLSASFASEPPGAGEKQGQTSLLKHRMCRERPCEFPGHPSWPTDASAGRTRTVLCPRLRVRSASAGCRGRRTSLRGRAHVALDGSENSLRPRRGHAKNITSKQLVFSCASWFGCSKSESTCGRFANIPSTIQARSSLTGSRTS
jgi:hypothetical protein